MLIFGLEVTSGALIHILKFSYLNKFALHCKKYWPGMSLADTETIKRIAFARICAILKKQLLLLFQAQDESGNLLLNNGCPACAVKQVLILTCAVIMFVTLGSRQMCPSFSICAIL